MKNKSPSDLLVVVFGPIFVMVIALVVGSLIYHAAEHGRSWMIFATVTVGIVVLLLLFLGLKRRHRSNAVPSSNANDESTRTI